MEQQPIERVRIGPCWLEEWSSKTDVRFIRCEVSRPYAHEIGIEVRLPDGRYDSDELTEALFQRTRAAFFVTCENREDGLHASPYDFEPAQAIDARSDETGSEADGFGPKGESAVA